MIARQILRAAISTIEIKMHVRQGDGLIGLPKTHKLCIAEGNARMMKKINKPNILNGIELECQRQGLNLNVLLLQITQCSRKIYKSTLSEQKS